jgi:hypothetical protein
VKTYTPRPKVKTYFGPVEICKKGLAKPAPFLEQEQKEPIGVSSFSLQKRKNRIFHFSLIPGLSGKSRVLLLYES